MVNDSNRVKDQFGFMTVENCIITGGDVAKYLGKEVPGWQKHGLEPTRIYDVYRPANEIEDADFSYKPLLSQHLDKFSAKDYQHKFIKGTMGKLEMEGIQLKGPVVFWEEMAIKDVEKGKKFLSAGYSYIPVLEKGIFNGMPYDIKMTKIVANHVAMVDNPRYKAAIVADENVVELHNKEKVMFTWFKGKEKEGALTAAEASEAYRQILTNDEMTLDEKAEAIERVKTKAEKVEGAKDSESMKKENMIKDKKKRAKDEDMDEEESAMDSKKAKDSDKAMDKKAKDADCMTTKDSDIVDLIRSELQNAIKSIKQELRSETLALDSALGEYERVCGKVNRMAFDSADKVLDTILSNHRKNIDGKSFEQKQAMVEMLPSLRNYESPKLTLDSKSSEKVFIPAKVKSFLERRN